MRDLITSYRMILKRRDFEESGNESQPLLSSEGSAVSFGTVNLGDYNESDTTDHESDKIIVPVDYSSKILIQRPFSFPGYGNTNGDVIDGLVCYTQINGFDSSDSSSLVNAKDLSYDRPKTQNSLVTIFAIWNTIMGTSLLAMPWGMERAGLFPGIFVNVIVAGLCLYTCYLILLSDLARILLGKWAEVIARIFSLIVLIGSLIVYWVLMSNFLYHSVRFMYGYVMSLNDLPTSNQTVICPKEIFNQSRGQALEVKETRFDHVWDLYSTVPVALAILMFPILNFKSPTVMYLLAFVAVKSIGWGINMNDWAIELKIKPTFCALSGMLSLSYFIHNIIISMMRSNRNPKNNTRDLSIAFVLVTFTYTFIGVVFYICFPLAKNCIEDNILNNFEKFDTMTILARMLLLFQLFTYQNRNMEKQAAQIPLAIQRTVFDSNELDNKAQYEYPPGECIYLTFCINIINNSLLDIFRTLVQGCKTVNYRKSIQSAIPILKWLSEYWWEKDLCNDLICGFTVAIMHIPQGMAYAILAHLDPIVGIYMGFFPVFIYAIFGTSRHVSIGLFLLFMYLFGLGVVSTLLSDTMVNAFTCAASFHVLTAQLQDLFGLKLPYRGVILVFVDIAADFTNSNWTTFTMSIVFFVILIVYIEILKPRLAKKTNIPFPIELACVILGTVISYKMKLENEHNVEVVGNVPTGLPLFKLPPAKVMSLVAVDSFAIAIISYTITISMGIIFAQKRGYEIQPNQELLALVTETEGLKIFSYHGTLSYLTKDIFKAALITKVGINPLYIMQKRAKMNLLEVAPVSDTKGIKCIIVDLSGVAYIDPSGVTTLIGIVANFSRIDIILFVSGCIANVIEDLRKCEKYDKKVINFIMFPTVHDAVLFAEVNLLKKTN
ncbi:hypothetical protein RN001_010737 [Aquatica leii]|uniref:STAS domain-containing protein n=1 Tax=Aquatica leii TaxID=1421715 RepID=A0AAN7PA41_9COLE|nr:hypothetical protein RN001_010737 [Aquatica leii]